MHLIKDENGNFVYHGYEHTHEHKHEFSHTHSHEHSHTHDHDHSSKHSHAHHKEHNHGEGKNKTLLLMQYMWEHNVNHANELAQMAEEMIDDENVAKAIKDAVADFKKVNDKLEYAVKLMKKE